MVRERGEPVTFCCQGKKLFGNLHIPREGSPCIVALHGLESSKDSGKWPTVARRLYSEGYACLRFNFRGCGEGPERSEGEFEDTNLTERIRDYKAALRFLSGSGKVDMKRIGVIGSSFGGMVAIAARDRRVKSMVTLSTPYKISQLDIFQALEKQDKYYVLPSGRRIKENFFEDLKKYDLLKHVKSASPILIIHGNADEIVPVEHAIKLYSAAREPKRLEIVDGANHAFSQREHLNRAIDLCLEWFRKHIPL